MGKHLCSGGSEALGWEGKEVQIGGVGRQDPWRRMLEWGMVGWVSPTGGRGLVGGISGEPSWGSQGQGVAHWATVRMLN